MAASRNMPHRGIPQNVRDEVAFRICVKLRVPDLGFGPRLVETLRWLQGELGQGNFARHKAETFEGEALGFHCRRTLDALDFLTSIPGVRLVDSTEARNHRRPVRMKAA